MTDLFAYPGEVNPNDVKASDPTVLRGGTVGDITGTATLVAAQATLAAAGIETFAGSSPLVASVASLAAAGLEKFEGQATLTAAAATFAAAGQETFSGTAGLVSQPAALVASGVEVFVGQATLVAAQAQAAAAGAEVFQGSAALLAASAQVAAQGGESFVGIADLASLLANVLGAGIEILEGAGSLITEPSEVTAAGDVVPWSGEITGMVNLIAEAAMFAAFANVESIAVSEPAPAPVGAVTTFKPGPIFFRDQQPLPITGTGTLVAEPAALETQGAVVPSVSGAGAVVARPAAMAAGGALAFEGAAGCTSQAAEVQARGEVAQIHGLLLFDLDEDLWVVEFNQSRRKAA